MIVYAATVVDEAHNPVLPEASELVSGALAFATLLVPLLLITFVVWQVVRTRQAAERAADAAERMASPPPS